MQIKRVSFEISVAYRITTVLWMTLLNTLVYPGWKPLLMTTKPKRFRGCQNMAL